MYLFFRNISEAFQSVLPIYYSTLLCSAVTDVLLFDGEGQPRTYLNCTCGKLTVFQAPLQGASSNAASRACVVREQHVYVFDFSPQRAGPSLNIVPLPSPTSTKEATLLKHIHPNRGADMPQSLWWLPRHAEQLPCEGKSLVTSVIVAERVGGVMCWFGGWDDCLQCTCFYLLVFLRRLVEMRPSVRKRRADVLIWSRAG